jgi:OmpA-OmpF porin, OOP family
VTRHGIIFGGLLGFALLGAASVWHAHVLGLADATRPESRNALEPAPEPLPSPVLRAEFVPPLLLLTGRVPDPALRDAVLLRARTIYGSGQVSDRIEVAPVRRMAWLGTAFPPDLRDTIGASALLQDGRLLVEGETRTDAAKAAVDAELAAYAAHGLRVDNRLNLGDVQPVAAELSALAASVQVDFEPGRDRLTPAGERALDELAQWLQHETGSRFEIAGHTDGLGSSQDRRALSHARATAVRDALAARGIDPRRFVVAGYGAQRPVADNATPQGRQMNRRIEFHQLP